MENGQKPAADDFWVPVGSDEGSRTWPTGPANAGISGPFRSQSCGSARRWPRRRETQLLRSARHAEGDDRRLSDVNRHHAQDNLHFDRQQRAAPYFHRRTGMAQGDRTLFQRSFNRQLGRCRHGWPLCRAGGRNARLERPPHLRSKLHSHAR